MSTVEPPTIESDKSLQDLPVSTNTTSKDGDGVVVVPEVKQQVYDSPPKSLDDRLKAYHVSENEAIVKIVTYRRVHLGVPEYRVDPDLDYDAEEADLKVEIPLYDFFTDMNRDGEEILSSTTVDSVVRRTEERLFELGFASNWTTDEDKIEELESESVYRAKDISELIKNLKSVRSFKAGTQKKKINVPV